MLLAPRLLVQDNICIFCIIRKATAPFLTSHTFRKLSSFRGGRGNSDDGNFVRAGNIEFEQEQHYRPKFDRSGSNYSQRRDRKFSWDSLPSRPREDSYRNINFKPGKGEYFRRDVIDAKDPLNQYLRTNRRGPVMKNLFQLASKDDQKRMVASRIQRAMSRIARNLSQDTILARLKLEEEDLQFKFREYQEDIFDRMQMGSKDDPLMQKLEAIPRGPHGDDSRLEYHLKLEFFTSTVMARFTPEELLQQEKTTDLRYPAEWFPATRSFKREFHLHVGPTNSGKTYQALKRLEQAETGIYAGPLRLLAHEIFMRLNAGGHRCNLVTGDERKAADENIEAPKTSCTVEMVPLNAKFDVAVIDEIQLIGSEDRGWAWTQAVLGVQAREVHVCGEERAVPIMRELAALCGEELHIHRYERLSPLKMMPKSLDGDIRKLQKGDCVVSFSVIAIHGMRQLVEKALQCKVAIIYGSLPPETRAQQARLFNDPDNDYDILIASDAVGLGLNLNIKRMIFQTAQKVVGGNAVELQIHEIKQIAGRAGRYSTAEQDMKNASTKTSSISDGAITEPVPDIKPAKQEGLVTTLEAYDYATINRGMNSEPVPIASAGIFPPTSVLARFVQYFPAGTPFSFLLLRVHEVASTNSRFHLCRLRNQLDVADAIEDVETLTTVDRLIFCSAPSDPRKPGEAALINALARLVEKREASTILDVEELDLNLLGDDFTPNREYLQQVEALHKGVITWMWLSYRYNHIFTERVLATHVKELVQHRIAETIAGLAVDFEQMRKAREQAMVDMLERENNEETGPDGKITSIEAPKHPSESLVELESFDSTGEVSQPVEVAH